MLQRYLGYQIIPLHVPGVRGEAVPVYGFVVFQAAKDFPVFLSLEQISFRRNPPVVYP